MLAQVGLLVCLFASAGIGGHRVGLFGGFSGDVGVVCQGRALTRELHDAGPEAHQGPPGREQGRIRASLCCALGTGGGTERKEAGAETFCERNVKAAALQMPEAGAKGQRRGPVSLRRKHPLAPRALSGVAS